MGKRKKHPSKQDPASKKSKNEEQEKPEPEEQSKAQPTTPEQLVKAWLKRFRHAAGDALIMELDLADPATVCEVSNECRELWTRSDMRKLFVDMWHGVTHGLEDNMDTGSMIVDVMLRVVEDKKIRQKLCDDAREAGLSKDQVWTIAGKALLNGWAEELLHIKI